jgi:molybdate transport system regulatory protein
MQVGYKMWLENNGKAFGVGPCQLLQLVDSLGSLNKAAQKMNMSYSQAWRLIRAMEKRLGLELMRRKVGGANGGGAELTEQARRIISNYIALNQEAAELLHNLYDKHFSEDKDIFFSSVMHLKK